MAATEASFGAHTEGSNWTVLIYSQFADQKASLETLTLVLQRFRSTPRCSPPNPVIAGLTPIEVFSNQKYELYLSPGDKLYRYGYVATAITHEYLGLLLKDNNEDRWKTIEFILAEWAGSESREPTRSRPPTAV
jgi:hypothetical protein